MDALIRSWADSIFLAPVQVLVNPVNTVGVMGKGLALEFKSRFPEMEQPYREACQSGALRPGELFFWQGNHQNILNFPAKIHWRDPSTVCLIEMGLATFVGIYEQLEINSIVFPQLGCGNGGLRWIDVRQMLIRYLVNLPLDVWLVETGW